MRPAVAGALIVCITVGGCGAAQTSLEVRVGSKKFTESVILGELIAQILRGAGARAVHRHELGGTQLLWNALVRGDLDLYPDYTGTVRDEILRHATATDEEMRAALAVRGVRMSDSLGFDDRYAIGMKEETAARLGISRISDLRAHPELRLGLSDEFLHREDGWPSLKQRYALPQRDARGMDHDLAYRALSSGAVDGIDVYTTDPEIRTERLRVLEDDLGHFPRYQAVILYRADLQTRAPEITKALRALEGRISERVMIDLNARAKLERLPEARVAAQFLGFLPPVEDRLPGRLAARAREHLILVGLSLLAALLCAVPLGVVAARRPRIGQLVLSLASVLQTIPSLALLVFMIPLVGIGAPPAIAALFLYSLLPIVRNTHAGLTNIAPPIRESARALGLSSGARLRLIELPLASPTILAGIKTAAVINVGTATLGALVGAGGFGQPILTGIRLADVGLILEGAIPAALLALIVQAGFELGERWLVPRGLRLRARPSK